MSFYDTRYMVPRKTCKFRLSQNSTKFDVVARFHETIPTVKSVSSSKIYKIFGFLLKLQFCPFSKSWNFLGSHIANFFDVVANICTVATNFLKYCIGSAVGMASALGAGALGVNCVVVEGRMRTVNGLFLGWAVALGFKFMGIG